MIEYQIYCQIRHLRDQDKLSITQIAGALAIQRSTVRKWLSRPKYERRAYTQKPRGSKLDTYKGVIVRLNKRAHNPLLKEAGLIRPTQAVPWLSGRCVHLMCP